MTKQDLINELWNEKPRGAWSDGVQSYAFDLVDNLDFEDHEEMPLRGKELEEALLNGALNWQQYSEGGMALCYDQQIAERLCNPTELKMTDHGRKDPNSRENWLDVQARALFQASNKVLDVVERVHTKEQIQDIKNRHSQSIPDKKDKKKNIVRGEIA